MGERIKGFLLRCRYAVHIRPGVWGTGVSLLLAGGAALVVPGTEIFGFASVAVGGALFLWGLRIHGRHLWQPWWQGKPSPFTVGAGVHGFDYEHGSTVAGIPWEQGFSHVWLTIRNVGPDSLEEVDVLLAPEHPIIHSRVRCAFADCRIAPLHGQLPQVTVLMEHPDGRKVGTAHEPDGPGNYGIDPSHRLHCNRLPSGATVEIDLATVVPEFPPTGPRPWKTERMDPASVRVRITWTEAGGTYGVEQLLELRGVPQDDRS